MNTTVERLSASSVRLTIRVPSSEVDLAIDAAYKRIAQKIKIPGFRVGRAPRPIIDTHVGRQAVLADAQDELLSSAYSKALDRESLRPITPPQIDEIKQIEPGADFEFTAQLEVRPELKLSSIDGLSVTVPPATASDAEIDAQIDQQRQSFASVCPVEDRSVQAGDYVLISFVGTVDGKEYDGNVVDRYLYEMNAGLMPSEFDDGLVGMNPGEEKVIEFTIPETSTNPEFVGKIASFKVTVHEIKAKVLPEVDDDFAASVGGFDSVEEMRASLRDTLNKAKQITHRRAIERAAREALAERLDGEVPDAMVESTKGQMMRDFINGLESRGIQLEEYLQVTHSTMEQIESDITEQARQAVREELALEALFRHQGWEVTDEQIDAEIAEIASSSESDPAELRRSWEESGVIAVLREQIMHRRAVEWLMDPSNVKVMELDPETLDANDKSAGAKGKSADAKDKE